MHSILRVTAAVSMVLAGGCAMSPDKQEEARISQDFTPLAVDPSNEIAIGPWWSDGTHLLNLRDDGGYSIYDRNNRYSKPIDRGRWGRQNYATLWLLPYTGLEPQRIRVQVVKSGERFGLDVPKYKTMFALAAPPTVMEDQLFGAWTGATGTLTLESDLTYAFVPVVGAMTPQGAPVVGHNGKWKLASDRITLTPSTPSVGIQTLKVQPPAGASSTTQPATNDAPATMEGPSGTLTRADSPAG